MASHADGSTKTMDTPEGDQARRAGMLLILTLFLAAAVLLLISGYGGTGATADASSALTRSQLSQVPGVVTLKRGQNDEFQWLVTGQRRKRSHKLCFGVSLIGPSQSSGIAASTGDSGCGFAGKPPHRVVSVPALSTDGANVVDVGVAVFPSSVVRVRLDVYHGPQLIRQTRRLPSKLGAKGVLAAYRYAAFVVSGCVSKVDGLDRADRVKASFGIPVCLSLEGE